jgi:sulfotransferase family protein
MPIPVSGDNVCDRTDRPPGSGPGSSLSVMSSRATWGSALCGSRQAGEGFGRSGSAVPRIAYSRFVSADQSADGPNAIISAASVHSPKMAMNRCLTWSGMFVSFPCVCRLSAAGHQDNASADTARREKPHGSNCALGLLSAGLPPAISDAGLGASAGLGRISLLLGLLSGCAGGSGCPAHNSVRGFARRRRSRHSVSRPSGAKDATKGADVMPELVRTASRVVRSRFKDSARWQPYRPRPDDIIIGTYSKCGTTWVQRIVSMLVFKSAAPRPIGEDSPWLDARTRDLKAILERIEAQTHRRFLKTHLPFDALPVYEGVKFIHVG